MASCPTPSTSSLLPHPFPFGSSCQNEYVSHITEYMLGSVAQSLHCGRLRHRLFRRAWLLHCAWTSSARGTSESHQLEVLQTLLLAPPFPHHHESAAVDTAPLSVEHQRKHGVKSSDSQSSTTGLNDTAWLVSRVIGALGNCSSEHPPNQLQPRSTAQLTVNDTEPPLSHSARYKRA